MIKQKCTFFPNTDIIKTYTEYYEDNIILYAEYDINNNKIAFKDYTGLEYVRKFENNTKNDSGEIIYYKDNNGYEEKVIDNVRFRIQIEQNKYDNYSKLTIRGENKNHTLNILHSSSILLNLIATNENRYIYSKYNSWIIQSYQEYPFKNQYPRIKDSKYYNILKQYNLIQINPS